jgi:hypothetical protein
MTLVPGGLRPTGSEASGNDPFQTANRKIEMKKLLFAGAAMLMLASTARADFHAAQPKSITGFTALECSVVNEMPRDRDPNPVYKINVNLDLNDAGKINSMGVILTTRNGKAYDRSEQYSNGSVSQKQGFREWYWNGSRGAVNMLGTLYNNDRDGWMYREQIIKNGRVEYTMLSDCHEQLGD